MAQLATIQRVRALGVVGNGSEALPQAEHKPSAGATQQTSDSADEVVRVLMVSSDPTDNQRLRLQAEERAIRKILEGTKSRDGISPRKVVIEVLPACTVDDLASKLLTCASSGKSPHIIHFSGHCDNVNHMYQLVLDEVGRAHGLPTLQSLQSSEIGLRVVQDIALRAAEDMNEFTVGHSHQPNDLDEIADQTVNLDQYSSDSDSSASEAETILDQDLTTASCRRTRSNSTNLPSVPRTPTRRGRHISRIRFSFRSASASPKRFKRRKPTRVVLKGVYGDKKILRRVQSVLELRRVGEMYKDPSGRLYKLKWNRVFATSFSAARHFNCNSTLDSFVEEVDENVSEELCAKCCHEISEKSGKKHVDNQKQLKRSQSFKAHNTLGIPPKIKTNCTMCGESIKIHKMQGYLDLKLATIHTKRGFRVVNHGSRKEKGSNATRSRKKTEPSQQHRMSPTTTHPKQDTRQSSTQLDEDDDFSILRKHSITVQLPDIFHESHCLHYRHQVSKGKTASGSGRLLRPSGNATITQQCASPQDSGTSNSGCCAISLGPVTTQSKRPGNVVLTKKQLVNAGVGSLAFESEVGSGVDFVSAKDFAALVSAHSPPVSCVILNACNSALCAEQLIAHGIPLAVCSKGKLTDTGALKFSQGFYEALAMGNHIERAFAEGLLRIQLHEGTNLRKLDQLSSSFVGSSQPQHEIELESGNICLLKSEMVQGYATSQANLHVVATENMRMRGMIEQGMAMLSEKDRQIAKLQEELEKAKRKAAQQAATVNTSPTVPGYARPRNGVRRSRISSSNSSPTSKNDTINDASRKSNGRKGERAALRPRKPTSLRNTTNIPAAKRDSLSPKKSMKEGDENASHQPKASTSAFGSSVPRFAGLAQDPTRYDQPKKAPSTTGVNSSNLFGWT